MKKTIKKNLVLITGIFILTLLFIATGLILSVSYKNETKIRHENDHFDKLDKFEKILITFNSLNRNKLLIIERVVLDNLKTNFNLTENTSDTLLVEAFNTTDKLKSVHYISDFKHGDTPLLYNIGLLNNITYNTNAFISLWQKTKDGYIRIASNEPKIQKSDIAVFMSNSEELIQTIEKGEKNTIRIVNQTDSKFIRSIPVFVKGKVKLFIQIIVNENLASSINNILSNEKSDFFILNSKGETVINTIDTDYENELKSFYPIIISKKGKKKSVYSKRNMVFYSYLPEVDQYIGFVLSEKQLRSGNNSYLIRLWGILSVFFIVLCSFFIFYRRNILKRRNDINKAIYGLINFSDVDIPNDHTEEDVTKEIDKYLGDILTFTEELVNRKFDNKFNKINTSDRIAKQLILLQNRLKITSENDMKSAKDDQLRMKLNEGSSGITEILQYVADLNDLAFKILKHLSKFLEIEQGAMFILNETEVGKPVFEMFAAYAYDKKRFASKIIPVNEGLIGRVYLEKESIFMTEIPNNYTLIESGFGDEQPKCLLIVPLIFNNKVQAILELASINIIEDYKIKFIENIGENIASTISNLKHTIQTEELLEQTKSQSDEIEDQRKTLEEKISTHRKQNRNLDKEILQLIEIIESIKSITFMIEYDLNGTIMDLSSKTLNLLTAKKQDLITTHHNKLIFDPIYTKTYENFWEDLSDNKTKILEELIIYNEKEYKLSQSYVPIRNAKRKIYRILSIGTLMN